MADKDIYWFPDTKELLSSYPTSIKRDFGFALRYVQAGLRPGSVKTFSGAIDEIREWGTDNDYRVYYVANLSSHVYVLHVMVKHSSSGVAIPQRDRELIMRRHAEAKQIHKEYMQEMKGKDQKK